MDKLEKILRKMGAKEQEAMLLLLLQIKADYSLIPGILKLKGGLNLYRVRIGRYRVIFRIEGENVEVIRVSRRNEGTYKDL